MANPPSPKPPEHLIHRPVRGADSLLAVACALVGLWLFCIACELAPHLWVHWLLLWPLLALPCVPVYACFALGHPRMTALITVIIAAAWLSASHTSVYASVLVHWTRSPGIPDSSGLEPETIKAIYRYGAGGLLIVIAALTVYSGGDGTKTNRR